MTAILLHKMNQWEEDFQISQLHNTSSLADKQSILEKQVCFLVEEVSETSDAVSNMDIEEILDGFADAAWVAYNGIYKTFRLLGRDPAVASALTETVLSRVCEANDAKRQSDGSVLRENGKVVKPEGWKAPSYRDLIFLPRLAQ